MFHRSRAASHIGRVSARACINKHVLEALNGLFGSSKGSDCVIVFLLEADATGAADGLGKRQRLEDGSALRVPPKVLGDPLPAHRFFLRNASTFFEAQATWADEVTGGNRAELRIPLRSEDEVPAARAAIEYAYTGEVKAGSSVLDVLQLRRQAQYLGMKSCAIDCDAALERRLEGAGEGESAEELHPPVVQLYSSESLWPDPEAEPQPTFTAVLQKAAPRLVAHFGDALKALNTPTLWDQLLQLPARGLEALLASDDLGTDDEAGALLLLAGWMKENYSNTDEQTRRRLCRTVRLHTLSRPYRNLVVPLLAADHAAHPQSHAGWFALGVEEVAAATSLAALTDQEQEAMMTTIKSDPWVTHAKRLLQIGPRPQCIPPAGVTFAWSVGQQELQGVLQQLRPESKKLDVGVTFDQTGGTYLAAGGFHWGLQMSLSEGRPTVGLFLHCGLPSALSLSGSQLKNWNGLPTVISFDARVKVNRWHKGVSAGGVIKIWRNQAVLVGSKKGFPRALDLLQPPQPGAGSAGGGNAAAGGDATAGGGGSGGDELLAGWGEYLKDGKVTGTLTLLPPPPLV